MTTSAPLDATGGRELRHFAVADEGGGFRRRARLQHVFGDLGAGAGGQFGQFLQRFFRRNGCRCRARRPPRDFHSSPTRIARSRTGVVGGVC